jgi:hypothetical protein
MGGASESVDAEPSPRGQPGPTQCSIPDDSGTQKRGRLFVAERRRQLVGVGLVGDDIRCVAPVEVPARESRIGAKILLRWRTEPADAARAGKPRHAYPVADGKADRTFPQLVDHADYLVTRNNVSVLGHEVSLG